jgi:hypothetical protein
MQDSQGDYVIGQGEANFYVNSPLGVAQTVETRLLLWEGEWFLNKTIGTPWSQEVLGYNTASLRDIAIKAVILGTTGVTALDDYASSFDPETREFTVSGSIFTQYSTQSVPFGPVVL